MNTLKIGIPIFLWTVIQWMPAASAEYSHVVRLLPAHGVDLADSQSIHRRAVSNECRETTNSLWESQGLSLRFPSNLEDEAGNICQEDDKKMLTCNLVKSSFYSDYISSCQNAGGVIERFEISLSGTCGDQSRAEESDEAAVRVTFSGIPVCHGSNCSSKESQEMTNSVIEAANTNEACTIQLSSGSVRAVPLILTIMTILGAMSLMT